MDVNKIRQIVNDYYSLEDQILQYAFKKFISREERGRFYLKDLRFDFYEEPRVFVIMKDAHRDEWYDEKYFHLSEFVEYMKKNERGENSE